MIKKVNDFFSGWFMTLVGGIFLLASFILPRIGYPSLENLAWVCVIICGIPLLYLGIWRIFYHKGISKISSALLISMAMIAALCIGDLFAAGEVAFIMEIGALLEDMTTNRAKKGLKKLISIAPDTGRILCSGKETVVSVSEIKKGDVLRILPGETIPVDGLILIGETSIDQSVMTGESLPVDKTVGDCVFSGTINRFGSIDIKATKIGKAIYEKAISVGLSFPQPEDFRMEAGKGISATIDGMPYFFGNEKYIKDMGIKTDDRTTVVLNRLRGEGKASVLASDGSNVIGIIALSDTIRPEAAEMIRKLKDMNTKSILLTGDNQKAAEYFARKAGISEIRADLLPEEKMEQISILKQNGTVCMIGDGINDAPALKTADVGVAMGAMGSDIAVDAADVALMDDNISKLPYLKWLSNTTVRTIKSAIALSMFINFVAVTLSVLGILNPTTGALVHNAGSCLVVGLAALLYDRNFQRIF